MRDDDYVSIVCFEQSDNNSVDLDRISPVHFASIKHMREAFSAGQVAISRPKGVEEGSEIRVLWPSASANQKSLVTSIENSRICLEAIPNGTRQTVLLSRAKGKTMLKPQVQKGDTVEANQIVASV